MKISEFFIGKFPFFGCIVFSIFEKTCFRNGIVVIRDVKIQNLKMCFWRGDYLPFSRNIKETLTYTL